MPVQDADGQPRPLISASEFDIVRKILTGDIRLYEYLDFMLSAVLGEWHERREQNWAFTVLCLVNRAAFGLNPRGQPGDVDVLVVPRRNGHGLQPKPLEVKVLRLNKSNRNKHPRPSGARQAKGLVQDRFPYVGLLHLILTEPSPPEEWKRLTHARVIDDFGRVELLGTFPTDTIGTISAQRQFGRLRRKIEGSCIGANTLAIATNDEGTEIIGSSTLHTQTAPTRNVNINKQLLRRIVRLCDEFERSGRVLSRPHSP